MTDVVDRLEAAMNAHDLGVVAGLIHADYRSEQPTHPGRAFTGRAQMLANWEATRTASTCLLPQTGGHLTVRIAQMRMLA